jgi:hypothetical protein
LPGAEMPVGHFGQVKVFFQRFHSRDSNLGHEWRAQVSKAANPATSQSKTLQTFA